MFEFYLLSRTTYSMICQGKKEIMSNKTSYADFVQWSLKSHPFLVTLNMHLHFNSGFCSEINIFFSRRPLYKCFLIIPTLYFMFRLKGCNGNVNMDRGSGSVSDSQVQFSHFILHNTMLKYNSTLVHK